MTPERNVRRVARHGRITPDPYGAGMTIGAAGGALAGAVLLEEVEEEKAERTPRPGGEI